MKSWRRSYNSFLIVFVLALTAWAQDQAPQEPPVQNQTTQDQAAPDQTVPEQPSPSDPSGRVARLNYMNGQVSVQPQGTGDWVQGDSNRPLTNGDNIWADKDSRAEVSFGTARARIDAMSSLTLTNVSDNAIQLSLHQGAMNLHVARLNEGEIYEVDTPNIAFTVDKPGDYRFDVDSNADSTSATVWKGAGDATESGEPALHIPAGQQVSFTGGNSPQHEIHQAPAPDSFDQWCMSQDQREEKSASNRYVNPGVVGSDDLDQYGSWNETPAYGPVWTPTAVYPGWAPYTYGQWSYIGPWGWTWVDAYPWGFAPFHYGRWVWWNGGWGWAPGPYGYRPWYAPALVAWWGGPGFGVGFGFGFGFGAGFGWCPLGFGEPFFPWYHASPYYFRNINIRNTRITNINRVSNNYFHNGGQTPLYGRNGVGMPRFATSHNALTAMSRSNLERGTQVRGNSVHVTPAQFKGASSLGRVDANPSRSAVLGAHAGAPAARPSPSAFSRPTVSRMTPPSSAQASRGNETASRNTAGRPSSTSMNGGRSVPSPTQNSRPSSSAANRNNEGAFGGRNVPRPPNASVGQSRGESQMAMNHSPSMSNNSRSVPRPSEGSVNRGSAAPYGATHGGFNNSVPRPTGRVMSSPQGSYGREGGGYSTRAYGGYPSSGQYGSSRFGSFPRGGSFGSTNRGYSAPSRSSGGGYGGYRGSSGGYHAGSSGGYHGGGGGYHGGGGGGGFHGGGHR
ncbi:MAG TPA: DUF6600 domain-containing protein [Terriglobales bacterium]|nr:DUF6600 domain-containing protein [Terriglobales bacterium]